MKKIAILGGTSHIAKGLILNFIKKEEIELSLFVRSKEKSIKFMEEIDGNRNIQIKFHIKDFSDLSDEKYDVLINCVGISGAEDMEEKINTIFKLTEDFDALILNYLTRQPAALCINFSSGAVFGTEFDQPVDEMSQARWNVNNITENHYYGIAKLNSEAKHRFLQEMKIVDIRVFGYFSRFIDLKSKYLMSQILACIKEKKVFITDDTNIIRDYLNPDDLFQLVEKCIERGGTNAVYDAYSLKPVAKIEILDYFSEKYGMKFDMKKQADFSSITGNKNNYYSNNKKAQELGYVPRYTSLEGIMRETAKILQ